MEFQQQRVDGEAVEEGPKTAPLARPYSIKDRREADTAFEENDVAC